MMSPSLLFAVRFGALLLACSAIAAATRPAAPPARKKVVIAVGALALNSSYPYLMMPLALGYWQDEGLDVEVVPAGGSAQAIQQIVGHGADFVQVNSSSFIQALSTGAPLRAVMVNTTVDWSLVVPAEGAVRSIADFKGRTIGIASLGSGGVPLLKAFLRANGLDPDRDVTIQPVGSGSMAAQALKSGRVDGLMYWASAVASFESAGMQLRHFRAAEWKRYADFSLTTLDSTLREHPEVVEAVIRGMAKASHFTAVNAECARRHFWKRFPDLRASGIDEAEKAGFDLRQIQSGVSSMLDARALAGGSRWAGAPSAGYERMQQFMLENRIISKAAAPDLLVPSDAGLYERANRFDHEKIRQAAASCIGV